MRFYGKRPAIARHYEAWPVPLKAIRPLSGEEAAAAYAALTDPANVAEYGETDETYPSAVCFYRAPFLEAYADPVARHVRPLLGYDIVPTYWYARLYGTGDSLAAHVDRGACFVSVSICLGYEYNELFAEGATWPLTAVERDAGGHEREVAFDMAPGEGMLYPGCLAPHWRDVFLGARCGQAFFHYVPADAATFGDYFGDANLGKVP